MLRFFKVENFLFFNCFFEQAMMRQLSQVRLRLRLNARLWRNEHENLRFPTVWLLASIPIRFAIGAHCLQSKQTTSFEFLEVYFVQKRWISGNQDQNYFMLAKKYVSGGKIPHYERWGWKVASKRPHSMSNSTAHVCRAWSIGFEVRWNGKPRHNFSNLLNESHEIRKFFPCRLIKTVQSGKQESLQEALEPLSFVFLIFAPYSLEYESKIFKWNVFLLDIY